MFSPFSIKAIAILLVLAAIGGILAHNHHLSRLYKAQVAKTALESKRANEAEAQVIAEQKARQHEREVNDRIDNQLIAANQALEAERSKPLPKLRCRMSNSSSPVSGSDTAIIPGDAGTEGHDHSQDAQDFDPSEQLMSFAADAEFNRNGWKACQEFVRSR